MSSGKKVAMYGCLGCGGFLLLIFLVLAGGIGFISYQGYQFGKGVGEAYQSVSNGYRDVDFQYSFSEPADGIMDANRTASLLRVRSQLAVFSRGRLDALEQTGNEIGSKMDSPGFLSKIQGAKKIASIISLTARLGADIGLEHVRLLNEEKMSSNEYQWMLKTYLGTLYKASQQNDEASAALWKDYVDRFESSHNRVQDVNINFGKKQIRGSDLDRTRLLELVEKISFQEANKEIVLSTKDQLFPDKEIGILDILAMQLDDVFNKYSPISKPNNPDPSAQSAPDPVSAASDEIDSATGLQ